MIAILAIARRELGGYFSSPIGWIALIIFTLFSALFFNITIVGYSMQAMQIGMEEGITEQMVQGFLGNLSVIAMLITPAITMSLLAQDRRERTIELLLTSPVSSLQIAVGKYLGVFAFVMGMVATTAYVPGLLYMMGEPDTGVMISSYAGFTLLMATFAAIGLFASSVTDNQLVALVIGFGLNLGMWIVGWFGSMLESKAPATAEVLNHVSMLSHFETVSRGVLHLNDAVYFTSIIVFFVFATTQRVESLRWR